jgi:hypothetical protein
MRTFRLELGTGVLAGRKAQRDLAIAHALTPVWMTLRLRTKQAAATEVRYVFQLLDLELIPPPSDADQDLLQKHLREEIGSWGEVVFDDRGVVHEWSIADVLQMLPEEHRRLTVSEILAVLARSSLLHRWMLEALTEAIQSLTVPLPEESIGVGATWSWTSVRHRGGFELKRVFTARLTSLEGEHGVIDLSVSATASPLASDGGRDVVEVHSEGTGSAELDLRSAIAIPLELKVNIGVREIADHDKEPNEFFTLYVMEMKSAP